MAHREWVAYKRFRHPNIIRCLDSCVVQDKEDDTAKIIYLFLPYYKNGTVSHRRPTWMLESELDGMIVVGSKHHRCERCKYSNPLHLDLLTYIVLFRSMERTTLNERC